MIEKIIIAVVASSLIGLGILLKIKADKKQKALNENEVIPVSVGRKTIYLKRKEVSHFKSLGRQEQRSIVNRFNAKVKSGKFKPVREEGKIIGFVENK